MTYGEKHKIKTYLVPTTYEMVEAMEKGEAPSFLHVGTCLDGLTNGEVIQKIFPDAKVSNIDTFGNPHLYILVGLDRVTEFTADWWNRKWGE